MPDRCPVSRLVRDTRRWCDLPTGHDGAHVSEPAPGQAKIAWRSGA